MNKNKIISELTTLLAIALRHKIGSIVNENELYAQKYAKDAEILLGEARKFSIKANWNQKDKSIIKNKLKSKLEAELVQRPFLNDKKFEIMNSEIDTVLRELGLEKEN